MHWFVEPFWIPRPKIFKIHSFLILFYFFEFNESFECKFHYWKYLNKLLICYGFDCEIYFFLELRKYLYSCRIVITGNKKNMMLRESLTTSTVVLMIFNEYLAYERNYCTNINIHMYNIYSQVYFSVS